MDNFNNPGTSLIAFGFTLLSIISGMIASITVNLELILRGGAAAVAMVSGFYAIRYYKYAAEKARLEIKQLKSKSE
jgi:hypothetical protein